MIMDLLEEEIKRLKAPVVGVIAERTGDPFRILISCLLSLRTRDETTADASERLFRLADRPSAMLALAPQEIERVIYPVSFYRNKTKHIVAICRILETRYGGRVPKRLDQLLALPGVGLKTANLVLGLAYRRPAICVDTHVHRISNRIGYIRTRSPEESERVLRKQLPKRFWIAYNDLLVPFGQFVCKPIFPFCSRCVIRAHCRRIGVKRSR
ncbi:MAG: endonuclease III domain-containing protein [Nitrospiria bacterium]